MTRVLFVVIFLSALGATPSLLADGVPSSNVVGEPTVLIRAGGDYIVEDIASVGQKAFRITFKAAQPTGKYDSIVLNSDHVHVAVNKGQKLRISAEILSVKDGVAEASQVLVFVPNVRGPMPVWLLSRKSRGLDLRASKYIEMHAPMSDYNIL